MLRARGNVSFSRKPSIDPVIGNELSKLARSIPNLTYGDQFPGRQATFGDMHFYTGDDTTSYKKNNWYVRTPDADAVWQSMNATSLVPENMQEGLLKAGVKIADYLSLFGGEMSGEIIFSKDQRFDPAKILPGSIPKEVKVLGYVPQTGGAYTGDLEFTNHNLVAVGKISGVTNLIYLDMRTAGLLALGADTSITLTAPAITLTGALNLTGDLALSGDLQVNGTDIGIATDTDLLKLALNLLTVNGDLTTNGNIIFGSGAAGIDPTITANGETNDGLITWKEDEDYFQFEDTIFMFDSKAIYFRDSQAYLYSSGAGILSLVGGTSIGLVSNVIDLGKNSDEDIVLNFLGATNDGTFSWMEDEDYFKFADGLLLSGAEELYFRDTSVYIASLTDGYLDLVADTGITLTAPLTRVTGDLYVGNNVDADPAIVFDGATSDGQIKYMEDEEYFEVNKPLQLPYLGAAPATLVNGMVWMEADGMHLYYAGVEKVVAGV